MPVVLATWEIEAGELFEPRSSGPAWAAQQRGENSLMEGAAGLREKPLLIVAGCLSALMHTVCQVLHMVFSALFSVSEVWMWRHFIL
jgi:hypothetical protein